MLLRLVLCHVVGFVVSQSSTRPPHTGSSRPSSAPANSQAPLGSLRPSGTPSRSPGQGGTPGPSGPPPPQNGTAIPGVQSGMPPPGPSGPPPPQNGTAIPGVQSGMPPPLNGTFPPGYNGTGTPMPGDGGFGRPNRTDMFPGFPPLGGRRGPPLNGTLNDTANNYLEGIASNLTDPSAREALLGAMNGTMDSFMADNMHRLIGRMGNNTSGLANIGGLLQPGNGTRFPPHPHAPFNASDPAMENMSNMMRYLNISDAGIDRMHNVLNPNRSNESTPVFDQNLGGLLNATNFRPCDVDLLGPLMDGNDTGYPAQNTTLLWLNSNRTEGNRPGMFEHIAAVLTNVTDSNNTFLNNIAAILSKVTVDSDTAEALLELLGSSTPPSQDAISQALTQIVGANVSQSTIEQLAKLLASDAPDRAKVNAVAWILRDPPANRGTLPVPERRCIALTTGDM